MFLPNFEIFPIRTCGLGLWIGIMIAGLSFNARYYYQGRRQAMLSDQNGSVREIEISETPAERDEVGGNENNLERQSSLSSAFSRIIPNTQINSSWLMRRTRRQQQTA